MRSAIQRNLPQKSTPGTAVRQEKNFKTSPQSVDCQGARVKTLPARKEGGKQDRRGGFIDVYGHFRQENPQKDCCIYGCIYNDFEWSPTLCCTAVMSLGTARILYPFSIVLLYILANGRAPSAG